MRQVLTFSQSESRINVEDSPNIFFRYYSVGIRTDQNHSSWVAGILEIAGWVDLTLFLKLLDKSLSSGAQGLSGGLIQLELVEAWHEGPSFGASCTLDGVGQQNHHMARVVSSWGHAWDCYLICIGLKAWESASFCGFSGQASLHLDCISKSSKGSETHEIVKVGFHSFLIREICASK